MSGLHLVRRYWRSVRARALDAEERSWVADRLLPAEWSMFESMSVADQRHHLDVARRFCAAFPDDVPRAWCAAALLHDVGKLTTGFGTHRRVFASLLRRGTGDHRLARYHRHEDIGGSLLHAAGSEADTVLLVGQWSGAPAQAAQGLLRADDI